jgi:hypothetical protein
MRTCLVSFRRRPGFVAACFLYALFAAPILTSGAARAQEGLAGWPAGGDGSFAQKPVDPPQSAPRWTFSAETLVLGRTGGANQSLVGLLPGNMQFAATQNASALAAEAFNSNQFWQGFSAGPKVSLTYHDESGVGVEFSYFNISTQSATKTVGPTGSPNTADWLVMYAPGSFWQTQDFAYQGMAWKDATNLYNAEANGRLDLSPGVTVLGGLRWLQLNDTLVGWLTPADRIAPNWKGPCLFPVPPTSGCALSDVPNPPGGSVVIFPPFWTTSTRNDLYGAQIGVDAKLLEFGRFSIDGVIKAGVFDNNAEQTTVVSMAKQLYTVQATTNAAAFVGEADLQVKYQLAKGLALKVGYEALWLDGVALAPGQIRETYTTSPSSASPLTPVSARALGVNTGSNVLFQGATVGLEASF